MPWDVPSHSMRGSFSLTTDMSGTASFLGFRLLTFDEGAHTYHDLPPSPWTETPPTVTLYTTILPSGLVTQHLAVAGTAG